MSRWLIAVAIGITLASPRAASADVADATTARAAREQPVWTLDGRVGYAAEWTTGVSHLGVGEGLALGRTWPSGLHLEMQALHFQGQTARAANDTLVYVASYRSTALQAGAGYELTAGAFRVRPGVLSGVSLIDGRTRVGAISVDDDIVRWMVGPSLACFVHTGRFNLGVDAQAFFVPSIPAAPSLGLFGLIGLEL